MARIVGLQAYTEHIYTWRYVLRNARYKWRNVRPKKKKKKRKKNVCVWSWKQLGMVGQNNILFCQNILFIRWCQNWEAVRKNNMKYYWLYDQYYHTTDRYMGKTMGHEIQPVQMPGPTYHKSQMSHPDQIHTSRHCLRISPLRQISGHYNLR